jgi:outer membrane protein assembly factor BamA
MERSFLEGKMRTLIGWEIASINVSTPLNDSSLLHKDFLAGKIKGYGSNLITLLQLGVIYDTRDLETDPTKGIFAEVTDEVSSGVLGAQYNFNKTYLHLNAYYNVLPSVLKHTILCGMLGAGYTQGSAPFFEYPDVWGSEGDVDGMGGAQTLRGFKQQRFVAPVMAFSDIELRARFVQFKLLKQHFACSAVPFFDVAGVWNSLDRMNHTENLRYSEGLGLRIAWNVNTILRFDYAVSKEDRQFFFQLGHTF